jgi:hypothetical protein
MHDAAQEQYQQETLPTGRISIAPFVLRAAHILFGPWWILKNVEKLFLSSFVTSSHMLAGVQACHNGS